MEPGIEAAPKIERRSERGEGEAQAVQQDFEERVALEPIKGQKTDNELGSEYEIHASPCDRSLETALDRRRGSKSRLCVPDLPFKPVDSATVMGRKQSVVAPLPTDCNA